MIDALVLFLNYSTLWRFIILYHFTYLLLCQYWHWIHLPSKSIWLSIIFWKRKQFICSTTIWILTLETVAVCLNLNREGGSLTPCTRCWSLRWESWKRHRRLCWTKGRWQGRECTCSNQPLRQQWNHLCRAVGGRSGTGPGTSCRRLHRCPKHHCQPPQTIRSPAADPGCCSPGTLLLKREYNY